MAMKIQHGAMVFHRLIYKRDEKVWPENKLPALYTPACAGVTNKDKNTLFSAHNRQKIKNKKAP